MVRSGAHGMEVGDSRLPLICGKSARAKVMGIACFNVRTGDVEDAPALNALHTFKIYERDGGVYIQGEETALREGQRNPNVKCTVTAPEKVLVIGG
jgi:hypothetical protein